LSHAHAHAHPHAHGEASPTRRLAWVLALTLSYMVAEVVGGLISGSLALLADAGHMLTDNLALALALVASRVSRRPPDEGRTYGYQRVEILAALANGVLLAGICILLVWESVERLRQPVAIEPGLMAGVATGGLLVNLLAAWILRHRGSNLNVRAAFLHVLGDLLGSVGALGAAGLVAWKGWLRADPAASLAICLILLWGAYRLLRETVHVLLEGSPSHLDLREIRASLVEISGVADVHDLHVWSLGTTPLLTAHLVADHTSPSGRVLRDATAIARERFGITHVTFQVEPPDFNIVRGPGE
jgi:cobalt-zinc-cadmium efflux system protein